TNWMWPIFAITAIANSITNRNATRTRSNIDLFIFTLFYNNLDRRSKTLFETKRLDLASNFRLFTAEHQISFQRRVVSAQIFHLHLNRFNLSHRLFGIMSVPYVQQPQRQHKQYLGNIVNRETFFEVGFQFEAPFNGGENTETTRQAARV